MTPGSGGILEEKISGGGGPGKQGDFHEGDEVSLEALGGMDEGEIDSQGMSAADMRTISSACAQIIGTEDQILRLIAKIDVST